MWSYVLDDLFESSQGCKMDLVGSVFAPVMCDGNVMGRDRSMIRVVNDTVSDGCWMPRVDVSS